MNLRKIAAVILCLVMVVSLSACGSGGTDSTSGGKTAESGGASQSTSTQAFDAYKKISIGMTKEQVGAALGMAPVAASGSTAVKGTFDYKDKDGRTLVTVIFNDKDILYSKTAVYSDAKVLAPMTPKAVTEEQTKSIQKGATSEEVVGIMGGDGVECSATALPTDIKKVGVIKRWGNKDGSFAQIAFTDDGKAGNIMFFKAR